MVVSGLPGKSYSQSFNIEEAVNDKTEERCRTFFENLISETLRCQDHNELTHGKGRFKT